MDSSAGVGLSPASVELAIPAGKTQSTTITVKNLQISQAEVLTVDFSDFEASSEADGTPKIIEGASQHGLKSWLSGSTSVSLPKNGSASYKLAVQIPANAVAGSYYGMVTFSNTVDGKTASIASLVFVAVGTAVVDYEITNFSNNALSTLEPKLQLAIKNLGQFVITPIIAVDLKNSDGTLLYTVTPEKSGRVLPGTTRMFTVPWKGPYDQTLAYLATAHASASAKQLDKTLAIEKIILPTATPVVAHDAPAAPRGGQLPLYLAGGIITGLAILASVIYFIMKRKKATDFIEPLADAPQAGGTAPTVETVPTLGNVEVQQEPKQLP